MTSKKIKLVAIVQARQGSSRLPGKTLKSLFGAQSTLEVMIERLRPSRRVNQLVVATTTEDEDDAIEEVCEELGVTSFRGSRDDVLDRYFEAAKTHQATHIVRMTADCPFQDFAVVDRLIDVFFDSKLDYASNSLTPTYPNGFDAEIMTFGALQKAHHEAKKNSEREHVTPYIYNHPNVFKIANVPYAKDVSHIRLTLDEPQDYEQMKIVAAALFGKGHYVHLEEILDYLGKHPKLLELNRSIGRNEGYLKSLALD